MRAGGMIGSLRAIAAPGNRERLLWAVRVRWLVIAGFFALALVARRVGLLASIGPCVLVAAFGTAVNAANHWCVHRWRFVGAVTALAIPGDVLGITYVVVHTGGVQSPFVMMYVVQVIATAMLVDLVVATGAAVASVASFSAALLLQHAGILDADSAGMTAASGTMYQAVWALFLLYCLGLLAYVGGYIAERLRGSERDLAAKNEDLRRTLASLEQAHADLAATVTRLQAAEAQLVQSEKLRALGQFVAGIAHELNNPIAFVSANIEHLERSLTPIARLLAAYADAPIAEPARQALAAERRALGIDALLDDLPGLLHDCEDGARRAVEIVTALRTFARDDQRAQWVFADLHDRLDRTLALLRHRLADGVRVQREYGDIPPVECLPGQLDQIFMNLLANAADAVPPGGHICIRTALERDPPAAARPGPHVVVAISDNGPGIPEAIRSHIFDPFFTTKAAGKGTGLGLSVSHSIVERHGGTIAVESTPGAGSTFTVRIPVRRAGP